MNARYFFVFLLSLAGTAFSAQADDVNLVPNGYIHLQFPQLPDTFYTMKTGKKVPAQLEARLPSNYSKDGKFPLCVFLAGGDGGDAGMNSTGGTRFMIGDTDFISVSLPLFKTGSPPNSTVAAAIPKEAQTNLPPAVVAMINKMPASGIISRQDYEVINSSYTAMLAKLFEAIPNIDPDRSVLAGFSNGAHTIGVLLEGKSPFVLGHFHSFCMVEGGMGMAFDPKTTLAPGLKNHRYLILLGDGGGDTKGMQAMMRPFVYPLLKNFVQQATAYGLDCSLVTMQNTGHTFNHAYYPLVKQWAQGGSAEMAPKAADAAVK